MAGVDQNTACLSHHLQRCLYWAKANTEPTWKSMRGWGQQRPLFWANELTWKDKEGQGSTKPPVLGNRAYLARHGGPGVNQAPCSGHKRLPGRAWGASGQHSHLVWVKVGTDLTWKSIGGRAAALAKSSLLETEKASVLEQ